MLSAAQRVQKLARGLTRDGAVDARHSEPGRELLGKALRRVGQSVAGRDAVAEREQDGRVGAEAVRKQAEKQDQAENQRKAALFHEKQDLQRGYGRRIIETGE